MSWLSANHKQLSGLETVLVLESGFSMKASLGTPVNPALRHSPTSCCISSRELERSLFTWENHPFRNTATELKCIPTHHIRICQCIQQLLQEVSSYSSLLTVKMVYLCEHSYQARYKHSYCSDPSFYLCFPSAFLNLLLGLYSSKSSPWIL